VSYASHSAGYVRVRGPIGQGAQPRAARALLAAGACVLSLALVWIVAELVPAAHFKDAVVLHHFTLLSGPHINGAANALLDLLDPLPLAAWAAALVALGLARGRRREAAAAGAIVLLAPVSAELLKPLLAHSHAHAGAVHIGAASWPSGHAAAALAVAMAGALLAPKRARPLVGALGVAFALAVGCALLIQAWHMPSDVLGGYLVAALWTALAVAALRATDPRQRAVAARATEPGAGELSESPSRARPDPTAAPALRLRAARWLRD
jgi:membrane-associated phospholipid phosphatase